MSLNLMTDLANIRQQQSWLIREWSDALGITAVESSIVSHLAAFIPQLEGYSEEELKMMRFLERREISKYTYNETSEAKWKRGQETIDRGATVNEFGKALAESPLRYSAQVTSWLADHAKKIGVKP